MIELPRAALLADRISKDIDFISFGTNDLTQTTLGISRDDSSTFMSEFLRRNWLDEDPFVVLDQDGVGYLIKHAIHLARDANPDIQIGICGEHAGNVQSIEYLKSLGIDYVSCVPRRLSIARLSTVDVSLNDPS